MVVGSFLLDGEERYRAAIWKDGVVTDLNDFLDAQTRGSGWILNSATDISNDGKITGQAFNTLGLGAASYLLTPTGVASVQR